MGGIERGLQECNSPLLLVIAVDLPRISTSLLRKMACRCDRLTGVVPRLGGRLEPLVAIYPKRCHVFAAEAIALNRRAVRDFAEACRREHAVRTFSVSGRDAGCFANWNCPTDVMASGN
jgi:molybdopterin-guanine dinucleotide biosynthesis protein A